jgi:hypothetical protein
MSFPGKQAYPNAAEQIRVILQSEAENHLSDATGVPLLPGPDRFAVGEQALEGFMVLQIFAKLAILPTEAPQTEHCHIARSNSTLATFSTPPRYY